MVEASAHEGLFGYGGSAMTTAVPNLQKMTTLLQFARKAGKLVHGYDACLRSLNHRKLYLMLIAEDTSQRTRRGVENALAQSPLTIPLITAGNQAELSQALGLPISGIFGIEDKQFATAINACVATSEKGEEPCK